MSLNGHVRKIHLGTLLPVVSTTAEVANMDIHNLSGVTGLGMLALLVATIALLHHRGSLSYSILR